MADAPKKIDLVAQRRGWFDSTFSWVGDFTGATFKMQVRPERDTTATPLIALVQTITTGAEGIEFAYVGTATIAAHIAAGRLDASVYQQINPVTGNKFVSGDNLTLSQLRIVIDAATVSGVGFPQERGDDWQLEYDLIGYGGTFTIGLPTILMTGKFIIAPGVTIP